MSLKITILVWLCLTSAFAKANDRAQPWKPVASLGSSELILSSIKAIVVTQQPSMRLESALNDLAILWPRALTVCNSGEPDFDSLPIRICSGEIPKRVIVLELSDNPWLNENSGSYLVRRDRTRIFVQAATEEGFVNGIYGLCMKVLGARWYWPTELGFEQVGEVPVEFPERWWRDAPDFEMRSMHPVLPEFSERNRLTPRWSISHALANIFTADIYAAEPLLNSWVKGRRVMPSGSTNRDRQPDFTHPQAAKVASDAATRYFKENPNARSFSLATNDNVLFDTSLRTEAAVSPLEYFRRRPNYTDLVFGFMNDVAERVFADESMLWTESGQPRYLTGLAYYWTEPSPSVQLHPRVLPVLTSDRAQWHDPKYRAQDKALVERWMRSGVERMATWDYYFGTGYPYPRQFNQWMDESLKHLNKTGVDVFYSQLPSAWGLDGAKAWLAAELLWDSQQDADVLLNEFYTNFFGAASSSIRSFYELAESYRNTHEGTAEWIKLYKDEAGIELFSVDVLEELRAHVDDATVLVQNDPRRLARVQVVSDAFRFTELYSLMHRSRTDLVKLVLRGGEPLLASLEDFIAARAEYLEYGDTLVKDPLHARLKAFMRVKQSDPVPLILTAMGDVSIAGYEDIVSTLDQWDWNGAKPLFKNVDLRHSGSTRYSFLGPDVPVVDGWFFDFRPSEHFKLVEIKDGHGVRIEGADMSSMFTDVAVSEGCRYLLNFGCSYSISPDNRTQLQVTWSDKQGKAALIQLPLQFPNGQSCGTREISIPLIPPAGAVALRIHFLQSRQYAGDFFELSSVRFFESAINDPHKR